jgi:hypothetical protein
MNVFNKTYQKNVKKLNFVYYWLENILIFLKILQSPYIPPTLHMDIIWYQTQFMKKQSLWQIIHINLKWRLLKSQLQGHGMEGP